ncbi:MAG: hypothetical protein DRR16_33270 [Candidatus Parabeggiatoa sp. nov. 3]|jgi:hypothetical protein|nr:MAG: hypothetical protein DRR00_33960 [Gammaproteobacteria bacterium]RKZ51306.1 MAG: hypothetical protein DRQ99_33270 [Gammaproteobacteria bacterium]RKZ73226.1 MAG: hypothetical protein DRR16_33270 [Gammaproteobacteria bacterium]
MYIILIQAKLELTSRRICDVRHHLNTQLETLDFAKRLWGLFQALINGALEGIREQLGFGPNLTGFQNLSGFY